MTPSQDIANARTAETPEWLTTPIEFEEQRSLRISRKTMHVLVAFCAGAVLWAEVAPIRELSLARGQLVPISQIRPVQHLEGGVVEDILAEPGQIVDKGQPLMRLQEVISDSDLSALRVRTHNLALETLEALLTGRAADFSSLGKLNAALTAEHRQAYRLRLDHRVKEHTLLLTRIAHRKAEIASLQNEIETQRKLVEIQSEQLAMRRSLAVDGNMSRKQVLDTEAVY